MIKSKFKSKLRSILVITMLLVTLMVAQAAELPGSGWYTTGVFQNVSSQNANLSVEAFGRSGTAQQGGTSATVTLQPNRAVTFRPDNPGLAGTIGIPQVAASSFQGSGVVSSDASVVAVMSLSNVPLASMGTSGGTASASYNGQATGATKITYSSVKSGFNGRTTAFFIQAIGGAATINVTLVTNDGITHTKSNIAIDANKSVVVLPSDLTPAPPAACSGTSTGTGKACFGAMTVTSTATVAGTVVEYPSAGSPATAAIAVNMFTDINAANTVYCPLVKNQFPSGKLPSTGLSIQNVSGSTQNISVEFKVAATNQTYTQNFPNVDDGKSVVASRFLNTLGNMPPGSVASAKVTAGGKIIAVATESGGTGESGYTCFADDATSTTDVTTKIAVPTVKFEFPSASNPAAANTGVSVQNVGTTDADITATYSCRIAGGSTYTNYTVTRSAIEGQTAVFSTFNIPRTTIPSGLLCSASFTSSNPIVAVATESTDGLSIPARDSLMYEGFNLQP